MKRFFQRVKQHINTVMPHQPSTVIATPVIVRKEANMLHYQPADDEPSLFTTKVGEINPAWMSWYIRKHTSSGYMAMLAEAGRIHQQLLTESPREYPHGYLPDILVGIPLCVSFNWVIWYKYEYNVSFEEAHEAGWLFRYA